EDGIRDFHVTGVQTCALPICSNTGSWSLPNGSWSLPRRACQAVATSRSMRDKNVNGCHVLLGSPARYAGCTLGARAHPLGPRIQIGRASCRERVEISMEWEPV